MDVEENIQCDIKVINACKSYEENNIIKGLNMNVQSGSIYGLLGASGCGKSTLLKCILGKTTLDSGIIHLKAHCLSDVGYMPQDLCLEVVLTIEELFQYYGSLYGMTKNAIQLRTESLTKLLQLPDTRKRIDYLSGGQCRRVSLALSILHDPKVIILDEPTVGIDPLLRQKVWNEFSKLANQHQKTILVTTHYIEEAAEANCVGFMRSGVLIDEGGPQNIIEKYESTSLESAFLTLCCNQGNTQVTNNIILLYRQNYTF